MSCEDNDDDKPINPAPRDCFWYRQGKCFLFSMSEQWVFEIMATTPEARTDLLSCANNNHCPMTEPAFVEFAERDVSVKDALYYSDKWQKIASRYIDRHRQIQQGTVFREADGENEGGEDE